MANATSFKASISSLHCHIVIDGVSFKYDRHALKYTIEDIDIHIPEGKVTAIVGASGSGKTTLIKLMLGFYPVNKGYITIAGENINRYSLKWWRRQCGVVMQEGVIFSESIARNIAVDDGEIDEQRMIQAAEMACKLYPQIMLNPTILEHTSHTEPV